MVAVGFHPRVLRVATLCRTLGGTECRLLTITESVSLTVSYYELLDMARRRDGQDMTEIQQQVSTLTEAEIEDENLNRRGIIFIFGRVSFGCAIGCK